MRGPTGPSLSPIAAGAGTMPPPGFPSAPPPQLSPAAGGYLGVPPMPAKKRGGISAPLIILGVVLLAVFGCCLGIGKLGTYGDGNGNSAKPTRSFDKSKPPPAATELRTALVSVADITSVLEVERQQVYKTDDASGLQGGLSNLKLCRDEPVDDSAIGSTESGGYYAGMSGYPYINSAVAGFYTNEAKVYFAAVREAGSRCGWSEMRTPKLGDEALGLFADDGTYGRVAIVFVRSGQVIMQLSVRSETSGSYQSDAIQLASRVAKRIPKGNA